MYHQKKISTLPISSRARQHPKDPMILIGRSASDIELVNHAPVKLVIAENTVDPIVQESVEALTPADIQDIIEIWRQASKGGNGLYLSGGKILSRKQRFQGDLDFLTPEPLMHDIYETVSAHITAFGAHDLRMSFLESADEIDSSSQLHPDPSQNRRHTIKLYKGHAADPLITSQLENNDSLVKLYRYTSPKDGKFIHIPATSARYVGRIPEGSTAAWTGTGFTLGNDQKEKGGSYEYAQVNWHRKPKKCEGRLVLRVTSDYAPGL